MQIRRDTLENTLQRFFSRRPFAGLEWAVLLCLVVIALLAESGLLGGALSLAP